MNGKILHDAPGRLRVHVAQPCMTFAEADLLEAYLREIAGVTDVRVYERTSDAVILYRGDAAETRDADGTRTRILGALSAFSFDAAKLPAVSAQSGRALQHTYMNRLAGQLLSYAARRLFLPLPVRTVLTVCRTLPYLIRGIRVLAGGRLTVSVLDAASIGVCLLRGEFDTAGSVMLLLEIGDTMEEWTHRKSVDDLAGAMALHADRVWLCAADGRETLIDVGDVRVGDVIVVRTGSMIPLDGTVTGGDAMVNQSSMTGESVAVHKTEGGAVYAGTVIEEGELFVTVAKESGNGRYDRIVQMIEASEKLKSDAETKASRLADRLVPWTFAATLATLLVTGNTARAASILMVDFCCALKLSMPIAVLSAMREAGTHHISVKGGKFMEAFAAAETFVFDKTGTLTHAEPRVKSVVPFGGRDGTEMLRLAACLEEHYPHSIANAVVREAKERGLEHEERHSRVAYVVAHGIVSSIDGERVLIGSRHFIFEDEGVHIPEGEEERLSALPKEYTHLYLAIGGLLAAVLLIEDPIRGEAAEVLHSLHAMGVRRVVMMTGDSEQTAQAVAKALGVDEYRAEVLPEEKAAFVRAEHETGRLVVMIGDGINDAPALSEADVGVAMNTGAAIAKEIADVTVSADDLGEIVLMRRLSARLMDRIGFNYRFIIGFNSFLMLMGALGIFPAATTALLHNASTILIGAKSTTELLKRADDTATGEGAS